MSLDGSVQSGGGALNSVACQPCTAGKASAGRRHVGPNDPPAHGGKPIAAGSTGPNDPLGLWAGAALDQRQRRLTPPRGLETVERVLDREVLERVGEAVPRRPPFQHLLDPRGLLLAQPFEPVLQAAGCFQRVSSAAESRSTNPFTRRPPTRDTGGRCCSRCAPAPLIRPKSARRARPGDRALGFADKEDSRFQPAAARWHARFVHRRSRAQGPPIGRQAPPIGYLRSIELPAIMLACGRQFGLGCPWPAVS
jgi:hypothetical protein